MGKAYTSDQVITATKILKLNGIQIRHPDIYFECFIVNEYRYFFTFQAISRSQTANLKSGQLFNASQTLKLNGI